MMTEFKMEKPLWCEEYGQVESLERLQVRDEVYYKVRFEGGGTIWNYEPDGKWVSCYSDYPARRLRNGIVPDTNPEPDEQYVTIDSDGCTCLWAELDDAIERQREEGGVIVDLKKVSKGALVAVSKDHTLWVNFDKDGCVSRYLSKSDADSDANSDRIACVEVTFTEGEGLS